MKTKRKLSWLTWLLVRQPTTLLRNLNSKARLAGFSTPRALLTGPVFLLIIFMSPVYFFLTNNIARQRTMIFNLDALGHYLMEFTGLLDSLGRERKKHGIRLLFLGFGGASRVNRYLLSTLEKLPAAKGISFSGIPPVFWVPLAALAETFPSRSGHFLQPMHPTFSKYKPLEPGQLLGTIVSAEKARFENYMDTRLPDWRHGYCVLGMRDSAYYGDTNSHRNSPNSLYIEAVILLLERGIPVVRMGRKVSEAFPLTHEKFLDIGFHGDLDDYLDVMLWTHASFAVGDSTGLTDAIALLGGKTFCATYPMDPRSFISASNYFFALQELREVHSGRSLRLREVIELMNEGWNIGDEELLSERGLTNVRMTASDVAAATEWFLSEIEGLSSSSQSDIQQSLVSVLARYDKGVWSHYRKDALFGKRWLGMASKIYPRSISRVL